MHTRPTESEVYSGPAMMRPTVAVECCATGSWTVRAGCVTGTSRRPVGGCRNAVAVTSHAGRLAVAVAAAPNGADEGLAGRLWVHDAMDLVQRDMRATAGDIVRAVVTGRPTASDDSLLVAVLPGRIPPGGHVSGTFARHGTHVASWLLSGGRATRHDGAPRVHDGEIWCVTTGGEPPPAAALWRLPPTPADLVALLTSGVPSGDRTLAALWAGHR